MEMDFCFRLGEWQSVSELLEEKKKKKALFIQLNQKSEL